MKYAVRIHETDNVAILSQAVEPGEEVFVADNGKTYAISESIKAGHKIALDDFEKDTTITKYGVTIGKSAKTVKAGGWVHSHNLIDTTEELCKIYCDQYRKQEKTILAYKRNTGEFGINNYIVIFPTSVSANPFAEKLSEKTGASWMVCDRNRLENGTITNFTKDIIIKTAQNPNIYAAVIIGIEGEEQLDTSIVEEIHTTGKPVFYYSVGESKQEEIFTEAESAFRGLKNEIADLEREPVSIEGLTMAVHCGGSDWTTALSGNPTLGIAADYMVENGGYVIMDEWAGFPGSEHLLAENAVNRKIGLEIIDKVEQTRKRIYRDTGMRVEETNPVSSNKEAGITTLVEKSTGNIKKAGSKGIQGVLKIGERPTVPGVYLLDQYCSDPVSTAAYAAMSGCHINAFVSGVGFIYQEIPYMQSVRITGNAEVFQNQEYLLDFNTGTVLEGKPMTEVGKELFEYILRVCEGKEVVKSESGKNRAFPMCYYENEIEEEPIVFIQDYREKIREKVNRIK